MSRGMSPYVAVVLIASAGSVATAGESDAPPCLRREPALNLELVLVPGGTFRMGSPPGEPQRESGETLHEVTLTRDFYLGRNEVTQAQWRQVTGAEPSRFVGCDDCPVEGVDALEVEAFLAALRELTGRPYRLPTEAEWERACRAGTEDAYGFGATLGPEQANIDAAEGDAIASESDRRRTVPVGSFPPNAYGLHDLHGNVWEWTADELCPYPESAVTDPHPACESTLRVIRGGSWLFGADSARCALRYTHRPEDSGPSLGFRVALDAFPD